MKLPIKPMLAKGTEPHPVLLGRADMHWEPKYDGYRLIAELNGERPATLWSRSGRNVTGDFAVLAEELARTSRVGVLDGEVVVMVDGRPSFHGLQLKGTLRRDRLLESMRYIAFDALVSGEHDLIVNRFLYEQRRQILQVAIEGIDSPMVKGIVSSNDGIGMWKAMELSRMEGMIGKPAGSLYRPGERGTWIKLKRKQTERFVVAGYTWGSGARTDAIGSLVLGLTLPTGRLRYVGKVGTGFTGRSLEEVKGALDEEIQKEPPFDSAEWTKARAQLGPEEIVWLQPNRQANVEFSEWTADGIVRFPSFKGLEPQR